MGNGIAQTFALYSYNVVLYDIKSENLEKALVTISKNLQRMVDKDIISENEKNKSLNNIISTTDFNLIKDSDLVVEAIIEDLEIKKNIFQRLPQPKKLILLKTKIDVQIERLKKRGHKRMKNINDFTRITRNISNYIEVNFKGEIHIINNLTEFNEILKSE